MMQTDNCSGQNKNNAVLHYMLWLIEQGMFEEVKLSFMIPGHTKVCFEFLFLKQAIAFSFRLVFS